MGFGVGNEGMGSGIGVWGLGMRDGELGMEKLETGNVGMWDWE